MEMNTQDYLKKTLLDTQERVRDFMNYAEQIDNNKLKIYFKSYAKMEGEQARKMQSFIKEMFDQRNWAL